MRKLLRWIVLVSLPYAFFEFICFGGLYLIKRMYGKSYEPTLTNSLSEEHKKELHRLLSADLSYDQFSSFLGWTIKQNGVGESGMFRANSQGIRANKEYESIPPTGVTRISSFGDSFTHGDEVANEDTWEEQMSRLAPGLEVLNFGVNAYGLDQAFLRYCRDGSRFNSDIVLIGFLSENILRNLNVFRPFYLPQSGALTKPYFRLEGDRLTFHMNPFQELSAYARLLERPEVVLPELGVDDYFFHTRYKSNVFNLLPSVRLISMVWYELIKERIIKFEAGSMPFELTIRLFDLFHKTVERNHSVPVIVVFPLKRDVVEFRKRKVKSYAPLLDYFTRKGYRYIDIHEAFELFGKDLPVNDLFGHSHYSPLGNQLTARYILQYLREHKLVADGIKNSEKALRSVRSKRAESRLSPACQI